MPYELILRPKSTGPVGKETLRTQLLGAGLQLHPDYAIHGILVDGLARFEIIANTAVGAGVSVLVKIPYGLEFCEVNIELLKLVRLAGLIEAEVVVGDEVVVYPGPEGLDSLVGFCTRYDRAMHQVYGSMAVGVGVTCVAAGWSGGAHR